MGEEVPLAKVLDESGASEWRGRREEVIKLREQVGPRRQGFWAMVRATDVGRDAIGVLRPFE